MELNKLNNFILKNAVNKAIQKKEQKQKKKLLKCDLSVQALTACTTTALVYPISNPSQGVSDNQRVGDLARWLRLRFNLRVDNTATTGNDSTYVRFIIFCWHIDTTDYTPLASDVLLNNTFLAQPNFDSLRAKKITILHDEIIESAFDWHNSQVRMLDKKLDIKSGFNASGTTGTHQLFAYLQSNAAAITVPNIQFESHVYFEDTF
jgi:hypothetical protein